MSLNKKIDLGSEGGKRFCGFYSVLRNLLIDKKINFDLIVAVGNSGLSMGKFAEFIFDKLSVRFPKKLSIPFYRFTPGFEDDDNNLFNSDYYFNEIVDVLSKTEKIENVLFIDDEIYKGITAESLFRLISKALEKLGKPAIKNYYIIAEDYGYVQPEDVQEIKFFPYYKGEEGHCNAIFYTTPSEIEMPIISVLGGDEEFAFHKRVNLLLDLPVKEFNFGKPVYTKEPLNLVKEKVKNFTELQREYRGNILDLINCCEEKLR